MAKFAPGEKRPENAGRKKGSVNKSKEVREAIFAAFETLGGTKYALLVGQKDPVNFLRVVGSLLPRAVEVSGPDGGPIEHSLTGVLNITGLKHAIERKPEQTAD